MIWREFTTSYKIITWEAFGCFLLFIYSYKTGKIQNKFSSNAGSFVFSFIQFFDDVSGFLFFFDSFLYVQLYSFVLRFSILVGFFFSVLRVFDDFRMKYKEVHCKQQTPRNWDTELGTGRHLRITTLLLANPTNLAVKGFTS